MLTCFLCAFRRQRELAQIVRPSSPCTSSTKVDPNSSTVNVYYLAGIPVCFPQNLLYKHTHVH